MRNLSKIIAPLMCGIAMFGLSACVPQISMPTPSSTPSVPDAPRPGTSAPNASTPVNNPPEQGGEYCTYARTAFEAMGKASEELSNLGSSPDLPRLGNALISAADKMDAAAARATGDSKENLQTISKIYRELGEAAKANNIFAILGSTKLLADEKFIKAIAEFSVEVAITCPS
ncbi:MAG: hypothetical protein FWG47_03890 [Propionibacteriaceae bacterium]|nr:hypothetical protein [Propionibacteriaceae bacterium]